MTWLILCVGARLVRLRNDRLLEVFFSILAQEPESFHKRESVVRAYCPKIARIT